MDAGKIRTSSYWPRPEVPAMRAPILRLNTVPLKLSGTLLPIMSSVILASASAILRAIASATAVFPTPTPRPADDESDEESARQANRGRACEAQSSAKHRAQDVSAEERRKAGQGREPSCGPWMKRARRSSAGGISILSKSQISTSNLASSFVCDFTWLSS